MFKVSRHHQGSVSSGLHQGRNISVRTYNGGIRELSFRIYGIIIRNYTGEEIPYEPQPIMEGMEITIDPSRIIAVNSEFYKVIR